MAGEWRDLRWGDLATLEYGRALRSYDTSSGRFRVFGTNGPIGWHDKALCSHPGVIIGRKGAYRGVHYSSAPFFVIDTAFYLEPKVEMDLRWAYYELLTQDINGMDSGSAIPSTSREAFYSLPVRVPPPDEQRTIACILRTLDDKIELNRRMNETLEAIARALFKSWFVDFDPVRAKAEGRDPGLPKPIADLFPDRFENSDLGRIPKGWEVATLGDVAEHPRRGVQPDQIEPETPYIALDHMPKRCIALSGWDTAEGLESNKFEFKTGEILFGKLRPYFHKVGVAPVDGVCSTDIVVVTPREDRWFGFVLGHVSSTAFVEYTNAGSTGTKMPRTSWGEMARYPVVVPPANIAEAFNAQIRSAIDRIVVSTHESRTLAALRDALLPKLLSGEIRIKDAKKKMAAGIFP
ncbi:MAG TPA: restriction endonuclease subunit S [Candidatus Deferrimicrobiaceae bacterium]|nr:restriction endonuclease subunit S [Candidatus Deferrimicrobiaceae bacterium]